jgi:hypothetical protein
LFQSALNLHTVSASLWRTGHHIDQHQCTQPSAYLPRNKPECHAVQTP